MKQEQKELWEFLCALAHWENILMENKHKHPECLRVEMHNQQKQTASRVPTDAQKMLRHEVECFPTLVGVTSLVLQGEKNRKKKHKEGSFSLKSHSMFRKLRLIKTIFLLFFLLSLLLLLA